MDDVKYQAQFMTVDGHYLDDRLGGEGFIYTVPFAGMGLVDSRGDRWIVDSVWHCMEKNGAMSRGNTVFVRRAGVDEDAPLKVWPDYFQVVPTDEPRRKGW